MTQSPAQGAETLTREQIEHIRATLYELLPTPIDYEYDALCDMALRAEKAELAAAEAKREAERYRDALQTVVDKHYNIIAVKERTGCAFTQGIAYREFDDAVRNGRAALDAAVVHKDSAREEG